ncbi:hypothetical protein BsWGS_00129 [Bradybaena similaris]
MFSSNPFSPIPPNLYSYHVIPLIHLHNPHLDDFNFILTSSSASYNPYHVALVITSVQSCVLYCQSLLIQMPLHAMMAILLASSILALFDPNCLTVMMYLLFWPSLTPTVSLS